MRPTTESILMVKGLCQMTSWDSDCMIAALRTETAHLPRAAAMG